MLIDISWQVGREIALLNMHFTKLDDSPMFRKQVFSFSISLCRLAAYVSLCLRGLVIAFCSSFQCHVWLLRNSGRETKVWNLNLMAGLGVVISLQQNGACAADSSTF